MSETTDGERFASGAADATRLAREVQELGFATARTVVERFCEMFGQFAASNGDTNATTRSGGWTPPFFWFPPADSSMQKLQSDMLRATEAYFAVLSQLNEASLRFFDPARWQGQSTPKTEPSDLVLPQVAPGGRSSARLWLHNTAASSAVHLRPWCPGLTSSSGASLALEAITCQPERVDLDPRSSKELVVTVAVGEDVAPGTYIGHLLVDGLSDISFPLRVVVRPGTLG
jgi:hypothetical protein